MILAAALFVLAQDPLWADLESPSTSKAYRAIEKLAARGPVLKEELEARSARAQGRLRTHLQAALQGSMAPLRRVTLKPGAIGVLEALQELARQSGLTIDTDSLADEKLPELALEVRDAHPLEALAAICRAAELSPSWEADRIAIYTGGFVDAPASRFGPFQLRLTRMSQLRVVEFVRPPLESFLLDLSLEFEHGLPLLGVTGIDVFEARDERGRDLRAPPGKPEADGPPEAAPDLVARPELLQDYDLEARLGALPKGAQTLALLRGVVRVRLPRRTRIAEIAQPSPGAKGSAPGLTVRVTNVRRDESRLLVDVTFEDRTLAGRPLLVTGIRSDGRRERTHASVLEAPADGVLHLAVEVQPRPAALRLDKEAVGGLLDRLRVEVVEEVVERAIPYEFRGVPLR